MGATHRSADWLHKEYPKTCASDDFWGQVKRTVNGIPVGQDQIDMIVNAIHANLHFQKEDIILDLGCGNGALSRYFFPCCSGMVGVDFSPFLIAVAKRNFEKAPAFVFQEEEAGAYVRLEDNPTRFTKAICYGAFCYFPHATARKVLATLRTRFVNLNSFFIGNLPDKDRIQAFYSARMGSQGQVQVDDHTSALGIWRTRDEMNLLARETGWMAEFHTMPSNFYAAHYRFDAVLKPTDGNDSAY